LNCIESIFNDVGLSYIFENQIGFINVKYITQILHEQFIQKWFSDIENSSRGEFYSLFKKNFGLENYLLKLPVQNRIQLLILSLLLTNLFQKDIILILTLISSGYRPSSTCTIKLGVEDLTFNIRLQKPKCTCSIILIFS
jgi:hypothetical protein